MSGTTSPHGGLTRRGFPKATGALAGAATTTLSAHADAPHVSDGEQVFCGVCRGNCAGGCFLDVKVRDGKVVRTSARDLPDTRYNRICAKGLTHMYRIYHPDRIKYPMRRTGERGSGEFERISWEEAISTICDKWKGYQAQYGDGAISYYVGSGNYAAASGQSVGGGPQTFFAALGALKVDACVDMARGTGQQPVLGIGPYVTGNEPADLLNARTIIVWASNPAHSQVQSMHWLLDAQENGSEFICIDPTYTATAAKADWHIPIRPGTDAALAMALMNIVIDRDWVDWDFVGNHSDIVFLVRDDTHKYLKLSDVRPLAEGEADGPVVMGADGSVGLPGQVADVAHEGSYAGDGFTATPVYALLVDAIADYTPERASEICELPVETIETLAEHYACNTPSTIYMYFGCDHWVKGHYAYRATSCLAALTGNLGKPGAFCGMPESLATNVINSAGLAKLQGGKKSSGTVGILHLPEIMTEGHYGPTEVNLKSVYIGHANIAGNTSERETILKALDEIEFIVAADMNMNETITHADIVLPAAHWFEQEDAFVCYSTHPYVLLQEKAIEPLYETKSDYEICRLILDGMGRGDVLPADVADYLTLWLDSEGARKMGLTYERLREEKALRFVPEGFIFSEGGVFSTPTKRAQFFNEAPKPARDWGQKIELEKEQLPYWEAPFEGWTDSPLAEKYPYVLLWEHPRWRTHSQWWDVQLFNEELYPEPIVRINPQDAEKLGVQTGDIVKLRNDRGYVVIKAVVNPGVRPTTLLIPKGWEKHQYIDGHGQNLHPRDCHPMVENGAFFDSLVAIEKM